MESEEVKEGPYKTRHEVNDHHVDGPNGTIFTSFESDECIGVAHTANLAWHSRDAEVEANAKKAKAWDDFWDWYTTGLGVTDTTPRGFEECLNKSIKLMKENP